MAGAAEGSGETVGTSLNDILTGGINFGPIKGAVQAAPLSYMVGAFALGALIGYFIAGKV